MRPDFPADINPAPTTTPKGLRTMNFPADKSRFPNLAQRLSAAISAGDAVVTDRAIRLARNRGDWREAERLTADFLRITGQSSAPASPPLPAPRDRAAVLATIALEERIGRG